MISHADALLLFMAGIGAGMALMITRELLRRF